MPPGRRTEVGEAADQDTSAMTAAVDLTALDALPKHVGRKVGWGLRILNPKPKHVGRRVGSGFTILNHKL